MEKVAVAAYLLFTAAQPGLDHIGTIVSGSAPISQEVRPTGYLPTATPDEAALHAKTCNYYDNRARWNSREGDIAFVTMMAEACAAARVSFLSGTPAQRQAARRFLNALSEFREVINAMNLEQYRRHRAGTAVGYYGDGAWAITEAGEVLIARSFGVTDAFETWLDTKPDFALAQR